MSHTPGPWKAYKMGAPISAWEVYATSHGRAVPVSRLPKSGAGSGNAEVNARLIAAAPELLAACRSVLTHMENLTGHLDAWTDEYGYDIADAMTAVIAKATQERT